MGILGTVVESLNVLVEIIATSHDLFVNLRPKLLCTAMVRTYFMAKTTRSGPFGGPGSSIFMSLRNMSANPLDNVLVQSGPTCLKTQRSNLFARTSNSVQIYLNLFSLAWKRAEILRF